MLIDNFKVTKIEKMHKTDWICVHTTSRCRTNNGFIIKQENFPFKEGDLVCKIFTKKNGAKYLPNINRFDDGLIQIKDDSWIQ